MKPKDQRATVLDAAAAAAGMSQLAVCKMAQIPRRTFARRRESTDTMLLGELRRFNKVAPLTDEQIVSLVRGK